LALGLQVAAGCSVFQCSLKRNPDAQTSESYNVLFEGRYVGRSVNIVLAEKIETLQSVRQMYGMDFRIMGHD
jgi:hypothetical protein